MPEAKPRVDEVVAGKKDVKEVINIPPPPEDKADADQIVKAVVKKVDTETKLEAAKKALEMLQNKNKEEEEKKKKEKQKKLKQKRLTEVVAIAQLMQQGMIDQETGKTLITIAMMSNMGNGSLSALLIPLLLSNNKKTNNGDGNGYKKALRRLMKEINQLKKQLEEKSQQQQQQAVPNINDKITDTLLDLFKTTFTSTLQAPKEQQDNLEKLLDMLKKLKEVGLLGGNETDTRKYEIVDKKLSIKRELEQQKLQLQRELAQQRIQTEKALKEKEIEAQKLQAQAEIQAAEKQAEMINNLVRLAVSGVSKGIADLIHPVPAATQQAVQQQQQEEEEPVEYIPVIHKTKQGEHEIKIPLKLVKVVNKKGNEYFTEVVCPEDGTKLIVGLTPETVERLKQLGAKVEGEEEESIQQPPSQQPSQKPISLVLGSPKEENQQQPTEEQLPPQPPNEEQPPQQQSPPPATEEQPTGGEETNASD